MESAMSEQAKSEDLLQRLLQDPEVQQAREDDFEKLPSTAPASVMQMLPPDLMGKLPVLMSALAPVMGGKADAGGKDDKTALLLALKPYMSPQRCDAIDKLITLARLSVIMKQLH
jgi:hypothetical protein